MLCLTDEAPFRHRKDGLAAKIQALAGLINTNNFRYALLQPTFETIFCSVAVVILNSTNRIERRKLGYKLINADYYCEVNTS